MRDTIAQRLRGVEDLGYFQLQDRDILNTLYKYKSVSINTIHPLIDAANLISRSLVQAESIDTYLDSHSENEVINIVGKISIVKSILDSEKRCRLYLDREHESEQLDYDSLSKT